jgi:hypothetical protein
MPDIDSDISAESAQIQIQIKSISWVPLKDRIYLHLSCDRKEDRIVITGVPNVGVDGGNVLLLL